MALRSPVRVAIVVAGDPPPLTPEPPTPIRRGGFLVGTDRLVLNQRQETQAITSVGFDVPVFPPNGD